MQEKNSLHRDQTQIIIFSLYLLLLGNKFFNNELVSQQGYPPLIYPSFNFPYWLFILSGLKDLIFNHSILKYSLDFLLITCCLLSIIKSKSNFFPILFSCCIWIYQYLYFSIIAYQPYTIGILFPCLPFIFKNNIRVSSFFLLFRYFLCSLYFLAGILKIVNGSILSVYHMSDSIKYSCSDYMFNNPNTFKTGVMSLLIKYHNWSYTLFISAILLELLFILGFFSKKYDWFLFFLFLLFHFSNYIILDLPFNNHAIILVFFLPVKNYLRNDY